MADKNKKVFCIGIFKTGTTSMGYALSLLGYKSKYSYWGSVSYDDDHETLIYRDEIENIREVSQEYDAFADAPWLFIYKELDDWYPNSKFILTVRNPRRVAMSEIRMRKRMNVPDSNIPDGDFFVERYEKHVENVIDYFEGREDDLLVMDLEKGDGWGKLCDFLDVEDIPQTSFPHKNKG